MLPRAVSSLEVWCFSFCGFSRLLNTTTGNFHQWSCTNKSNFHWLQTQNKSFSLIQILKLNVQKSCDQSRPPRVHNADPNCAGWDIKTRNLLWSGWQTVSCYISTSLEEKCMCAELRAAAPAQLWLLPAVRSEKRKENLQKTWIWKVILMLLMGHIHVTSHHKHQIPAGATPWTQTSTHRREEASSSSTSTDGASVSRDSVGSDDQTKVTFWHTRVSTCTSCKWCTVIIYMKYRRPQEPG